MDVIRLHATTVVTEPVILVVDTLRMFAEGLQRTLTEHGFRVAGAIAPSDDELGASTALDGIDVVLLDAMALETAPERCRMLCMAPVPVLLLAAPGRSDLTITGVALGARGFVPRTTQTSTLALALRTVASGAAVISPTMARRAAAWIAGATDGRFHGLGREQLELWAAVARDESIATIASRGHVSERTARRLVAELLLTLGVSSRLKAAELAGRLRLLDIIDEIEAGGPLPWWVAAPTDRQLAAPAAS